MSCGIACLKPCPYLGAGACACHMYVPVYDAAILDELDRAKTFTQYDSETILVLQMLQMSSWKSIKLLPHNIITMSHVNRMLDKGLTTRFNTQPSRHGSQVNARVRVGKSGKSASSKHSHSKPFWALAILFHHFSTQLYPRSTVNPEMLVFH